MKKKLPIFLRKAINRIFKKTSSTNLYTDSNHTWMLEGAHNQKMGLHLYHYSKSKKNNVGILQTQEQAETQANLVDSRKRIIGSSRQQAGINTARRIVENRVRWSVKSWKTSERELRRFFDQLLKTLVVAAFFDDWVGGGLHLSKGAVKN